MKIIFLAASLTIALAFSGCAFKGRLVSDGKAVIGQVITIVEKKEAHQLDKLAN